MEAAYTRSLDSRHNPGIQDSLPKGATSILSGSLRFQTGGGCSYYRRDTVPLEEGSHSGVQGTRRIHKQHIPGAKGRREVEADTEPEIIERICGIRTFQDGRHSLCERSTQQGRSHVQAGSKRCIPLDSDPRVMQEVSQVQMARDTVRVHSPSLWALGSPKNLYKGLETSPSSIEGCRDTPSGILGRFSHSWRDQGRGRSSISEDQEPIAKPGICDKPGEISEPGNPKNRISGVCHRFKRDGVQASSEKSEADQERMQEDSAERPGDCEGAGTSSGCPSSFSPGSFTSSAALSGTSGPEKRRSSPPPLIWINSGLECKEPRESEVVDQTPQQSEWPAHSSSTSHHDHRIRCIQYRMGSPLWISQDQGSVVNYRGQIAHQLQRDVSSFPGLTDICEGQEGDTCPVQDRQHHNNVLYQSHGRHTLPAYDAVDIRHVELEPREGDPVVSGTPTGQAKLCSRSGIQNTGRQFRVEAEAIGVQAANGAVGPMSDRPFCITPDSAVEDIHELEARSGCRGNGCPVSVMESDQGLCIPTFLINWKMSDQSTTGAGPGDSTDHTNMANSDLVSSVGFDDCQKTDTSNAGPVNKPQKRESPTDQPRVSESSRVASIRRSLSAEGISEAASKLILASWRNSTEGAYSSCWSRWERWCAERGLEAIRSPLNAILEFLAFEYLQGKQYRTINSYRSAISMTHGAIDGVVIGKHPLVSRLIKGIYNQRPPQPRYSSTWDVKVVLDHIKSWGYTGGLPLKKLNLKLAMLLALANASRCSELHALEIQRMTWSAEGVTFALAALTKTSKPGKSKTLFYPMLEADREVCPVTSLSGALRRD